MARASRDGIDHAPCEGQVSGVAAAFEVCKQSLENLMAGKPFQPNGQLRMFESYEGVVKHADGDQVIVVYEVEEDLVEQTYVAKQFVDGKLPKPGDRLAVFVHVAQLPDEQDEAKGEKAPHEQRRHPKNFVPFPRTV